jgi:hypothetical protein
MMDNRITMGIREVSPCNGCPERFTACSSKCPKDARGERGYKAWKAELDAANEKRKEYDRMKWRRKW